MFDGQSAVQKMYAQSLWHWGYELKEEGKKKKSEQKQGLFRKAESLAFRKSQKKKKSEQKQCLFRLWSEKPKRKEKIRTKTRSFPQSWKACGKAKKRN